MHNTMMKTLMICSALVACSAAGAVALAALHDATGPQTARAVQPAPAATVEQRFVIPSFAPSAQPKAPEVVQVALLDAPASDVVLQDVVPAPRAEPAAAEAAAPVIVETPKPVQRAVVAPKPRPAAAPKPQPQPRAKARTAKPVIVAQAPAFLPAQRTAVQPDYVIGVYR